MSETVETAMRHGISGQFLDDEESFSEISCLFDELSSANAKLNDVEARLLNCNHPVWLRSFKNRCQRLKHDRKATFLSLVQNLEAKKTVLQGNVIETRDKLLALEPTALKTSETLSGPFIAFSAPPVPRRKKDPDVIARNSVIDRHVDLSDIAICQLLDTEFPSNDGRPATGLPERIFVDFGVLTYTDAYECCSQRIHTIISKRRREALTVNNHRD